MLTFRVPTPTFPLYDKSDSRLLDDIQAVVGAGPIIHSLALALEAYYVAIDATVLIKLVEELEPAMPSIQMIPLGDLDKLLHLTSVYLEMLHGSYVVSHRLQPVCPDQEFQYYDYILAPGTSIA